MFKKLFIISCFFIMFIPGLTFARPVCSTIDQCLTLAKQENVEAQSELGQLYLSGKSETSNRYQEALTWFKKAADKGDQLSQYYLGLMYYQGKGVKKDYNQAFDWFTKAAAAGNEQAQYYLGFMYYQGEGIKKDYDKALDWFTKAAATGNKQAKYYLKLLEEKK